MRHDPTPQTRRSAGGVPGRGTALLASAALALCGCGESARYETPRNLLLISVDTLRADALGAYGATQGDTPSIDALARGAVVFENAVSQSSWTLPAFASILTSTYPSTHEVDSFRASLDPSFRTLGEVLTDAGFATGAVTSHVYVGPKHGMDQGIDDFDDSLVREMTAQPRATSPVVSERGLGWMEEAVADGERWFLWLHYFDPHFPYVRHDDPEKPEGATRDDYRADVAYTDRWIGEVLDGLERLGAADDTLVVLVSDHGEEFREHDKLRHGFTLFREVVHVPLIARVPGVAPRRVRGAVGGVDVLPTVLQLLDLPTPERAVGRSLVPAMLGGTLSELPILSELRLNPAYHSDSVRLGRWKLVLDRSGRSTLGFAASEGGPPTDWSMQPNPPQAEQGLVALLYEVESDPHERHDVADEHPEQVARLRSVLESMQARARAGAIGTRDDVEHSAQELRVLRQLGYVGGHDH